MLGSGSRLVPGFIMKGDSIAGRYRVDKVLGTGPSGFVVAARHIHSREKVALKVFTGLARPQPEKAAGLASPNIARVVDTGFTADGEAFIATEWIDGKTFAEVLAEQGRIAPRLAVSMIRQTCAGLFVAHGNGVVHGDLKPQNLFLGVDGVVRILDFGMTMARADENEEASAAWFASPAYLAPEQLRDPACDARADVWALGVILHELVAGKLPFDAETIAGMFVAVAYDEPALLVGADVPYELARVVHECLAKNPNGRPPNVMVLAERLAPFAPTVEAESMSPQLTMTVDAQPSSVPLVPESHVPESHVPVSDAREPLASSDLIEPSPLSRMQAFEKTSSRPPPLPASKLGAKPRAALERAVEQSIQLQQSLQKRVGRGWLAARLMAASVLPPAETPQEQAFQRRRWGAAGVVGGAAVLGLVGLCAAPSSDAAATTTTAAALEPESAVQAEPGLAFGLGAFVPPSFALREKESDTMSDRAPTPPAALPVRWTPPPRTRLFVREDPYSPHGSAAAPKRPATGFTHPRALERRR